MLRYGTTEVTKIYRFLYLNEKDKEDLEKISELVGKSEVEEELKNYISRHENDNNHWILCLLIQNKLKLSKPSTFNDPYDCNVAFDPKVADQDLFRMFVMYYKNSSFSIEDKEKFRTEVENKNLIDQIEKYSSSPLKESEYKELDPKDKELMLDMCKITLQKIVMGSLLICFSKIPDNILMWAHYAGKHEGYCLEFSVDKMKKSFLWTQGLYDIDYSEENLRPLIGMSNEELKNMEMATKVLLRKSHDWGYEEEVRYIHGHIGFNGIEKEYFEFSPDCLTNVIFGAKMPFSYQKGFSVLIQGLQKYKTTLSSAKLNSYKYQVDIEALKIHDP